MAEVGEPVGLKANWSSEIDLMRGLIKDGQIWSSCIFIEFEKKYEK